MQPRIRPPFPADKPWFRETLDVRVMFTIFIKPAGDRPDFRVVLAFLWGDDHNCDTDGDSDNPASREWTCLYASSRERPGEVVDIFPQQKQPLVLGVESPIESLAAGAAYISWGRNERDCLRKPKRSICYSIVLDSSSGQLRFGIGVRPSSTEPVSEVHLAETLP